MSDLISRAAAIEAIDAKCKRYFESVGITDFDYYKADEQSRWLSDGAAMAVDAILDLPSAERVGKWIKAEKGGEWWCACSICSMHIPKTLWGQDWHSSYCPNCGARMEGDGDDQ